MPAATLQICVSRDHARVVSYAKRDPHYGDTNASPPQDTGMPASCGVLDERDERLHEGMKTRRTKTKAKINGTKKASADSEKRNPQRLEKT